MLTGIKVVEIAQNLSAPYGGAILASLGAEVIKIEKPEGGDDARGWGPPFHDDASVIFRSVNRNKSGVTLDLKQADRTILDELLSNADIFLHNLRPGSAPKLGLDPDTLRRRFPRLICCELGAFGHIGPLRMQPGYEPLMQAFAGIFSINGHPDGAPARVGVSIVDLGAGMWTVIGALAALERRNRTGEGCTINTSLFETALGWSGLPIESYLASGEPPRRHGTGHFLLVPFQAFDTATGPMVVAAGNDRIFGRFAALLEHPEWGDDPKYRTNSVRYTNKAALVSKIQAVMLTKSRETWTERFVEAGIPTAPVLTIPEAIEHPQTQALSMIQKTPDRSLSLVGLPISFDGERPQLSSEGPMLKV